MAKGVRSLAALALLAVRPGFSAAAPGGEVAALRRETARVMTFSPAQIDAWIVPRATFENIACPNCEGGTPEKPRWNWTPDRPDRITCRYCGMTFPNAKYPLDRVAVVRDPAGTVQHFAYREGKNGYRYYLRMRVENDWKRYMEHQALALARLCAATGDRAAGRQAALILDRLAAVYPHYNVHGFADPVTFPPVIYELPIKPVPASGLMPVPGFWKDLAGYNRFPPLGKSAYPYFASRRGDGTNNWYYGEMSPDLIRAYELVAAADCPELNRAAIQAFFRASANYVRAYPIYLGNMDPLIIRGLALTGRAIGEPEFVRDALRRANALLRWQFFPDGFWREGTPAYMAATLDGLRDALPEDLAGELAKEPMMREASTALDELRMPNREYLSLKDTWTATTLGKPVPPVSAPFATRLYWGMGEAMLGTGGGDGGVQADLHFGPAFPGHAHDDDLDLVIFGRGRELVPDLGYTHTKLRPFVVSSLAHDLVVVDQRNQQLSEGRLVGWAAAPGGLRFAEAGDEGAYPGVVSAYRRAVAVVPLPAGGAYVFDVFRVRGGSRHDWLLHGGADAPGTVACSVPLRPAARWSCGPWPDPVPMLEADAERGPGESIADFYGLFDSLAEAAPVGPFTLTFRDTAHARSGLRTTIVAGPGARLFVGTLPSMRLAREDNRRILRERMPVALLRRDGRNLDTAIAAVHEPFRGAPSISAVEPLPLAREGDGAVAVRCAGPDFVDYQLSGLDAGSSIRAAGLPLSARARYAFVRVRRGKAVAMTLVDGTEVRFGNRVLQAAAPPAGKVVGVESREAGAAEDAVLVDTPLAPRPGRPNERVIVEFGDGSTYALAVDRIRPEAGRTAIVLSHRPGFTLSPDLRTATQTHVPHRAMPGQPRFRLPNVAEWPGSPPS